MRRRVYHTSLVHRWDFLAEKRKFETVLLWQILALPAFLCVQLSVRPLHVNSHLRQIIFFPPY